MSEADRFPEPESARGAAPFWPFFAALVGVLTVVGALNYAVDPLWFVGGNKLTGVNFLLNERVAKVNRLSHLKVDEIDCLILGSSRVDPLRASAFEGRNCFNLALIGAGAPEMLAYAREAHRRGLRPRYLYVGVEDFNFVVKPETERPQVTVAMPASTVWEALFSADVASFSVLTLAGLSPDAYYWYDRDFELQQFDQPAWKPHVEQLPKLRCTNERVDLYRQLRALYPEAVIVGYASPVAPWQRFKEWYLRGVLDCSLQGFHQVAEIFDGFLDFSIPSPLTLDTSNTYDGSHFSPTANLRVIAELQGRSQGLAIDVKKLETQAYISEVHRRFKAFAEEHDLMRYWQD